MDGGVDGGVDAVQDPAVDAGDAGEELDADASQLDLGDARDDPSPDTDPDLGELDAERDTEVEPGCEPTEIFEQWSCTAAGCHAPPVAAQVTFAMLNAFGRGLGSRGDGGRGHNRHHNVMVAFGPNVRAGVIGGLDSNLRASGIDPATGAAVQEGGIPVNATLEAAGYSLMRACGHSDQAVRDRLRAGAPVPAFLRG